MISRLQQPLLEGRGEKRSVISGDAALLPQEMHHVRIGDCEVAKHLINRGLDEEAAVVHVSYMAAILRIVFVKLCVAIDAPSWYQELLRLGHHRGRFARELGLVRSSTVRILVDLLPSRQGRCGRSPDQPDRGKCG
jgi:hypothetical protein